MDNGFKLGKILGIQFKVHYSWFFIFILVSVFLAWQVFPVAVPGESSSTYWLMGGITAFLFFFSVLVHEASHSIVGRSNGIPVTSINLFLFGGAAQMSREPGSAGAEIKMAMAGPLSSLGLAAIFYLAYIYFIGLVNTQAAIALWLTQINLIVAGFNLLPGFPLDGGRILRGLWWHFKRDYEGATRISIFFGRAVGVLIIVAGLYFIVYYRDWLAGIWLIVVGFYLESSARSSLSQFELQIWLKGKSVTDVLSRDCPAVDIKATISELKQSYPEHRCFKVIDGGSVRGAAYVPAPDHEQDSRGIGELTSPLEEAVETTLDYNLLSLVQDFNESGKDFAVVKKEGEEMGFVFLDKLIDLVNNYRIQVGKDEHR